MRSIALVAFFLGLTTFAAAQTTPQATSPKTAEWSYQGKTGALNWGKLDPAYRGCSKGREQSPIDIRGAHLNPALPPLKFHYISGQVTLVNDGHTIVAHVNPGSYLVVGDQRYELVEIDFRHPGEQPVKGKLTDFEVHLRHRSTDGKLAEVVVRLVEDPGNPNATLAALWQHLPKTPGASEKVTEIVSIGGLLPADRGYWVYTGSLSTPPCTEGVRWFVLEQELSLSREQLHAFQTLYRMNTRGAQDTNGRRIEANE